MVGNMTIPVDCPKCSLNFIVDRSFAGGTVQCPRCANYNFVSPQVILDEERFERDARDAKAAREAQIALDREEQLRWDILQEQEAREDARRAREVDQVSSSENTWQTMKKDASNGIDFVSGLLVYTFVGLLLFIALLLWLI